MRRPEEAGCVSASEAFLGRRPRTTCRIIVAGRRALAEHFRTMRFLANAVGLASEDAEKM